MNNNNFNFSSFFKSLAIFLIIFLTITTTGMCADVTCKNDGVVVSCSGSNYTGATLNGDLRNGINNFCKNNKDKIFILKTEDRCSDYDPCDYGVCGTAFKCEDQGNGRVYKFFTVADDKKINYLCHCKNSNDCLSKNDNDKVNFCITDERNAHFVYRCSCKNDSHCFGEQICANNHCIYKKDICGKDTEMGNATCDITTSVCHKLQSNNSKTTYGSICLNKFCNSADDCGRYVGEDNLTINGINLKLTAIKNLENNQKPSEVPLKYLLEVDKWACVDHVCVDASCANQTDDFESSGCSKKNSLGAGEVGENFDCGDQKLDNKDGLKTASNFKNRTGMGSRCNEEFEEYEGYSMKNFVPEGNFGDVGCQYCAYRKARFCSELHRGYYCMKHKNALHFKKQYQADDVDVIGYNSFSMRVFDICIKSPKGIAAYIKFKCPEGANKKFIDETTKPEYPLFTENLLENNNTNRKDNSEYLGLQREWAIYEKHRYNKNNDEEDIRQKAKVNDTAATNEANLYVDDFVRYIRLYADWSKYKSECGGSACGPEGKQNVLYNDARSYVECLKACGTTNGISCAGDENCCTLKYKDEKEISKCVKKLNRELHNIDNYIGRGDANNECGLKICELDGCKDSEGNVMCKSCNIKDDESTIFF